ncbi:MAG: bacillithiol biosynthesis deacetylase BshB1 [Bacteroidia bacterium]
MYLDILVFAAHPDDAELSCSGTLMHHMAMGKKVGIIDLTRGELGTRGSAELRDEEARKSSKILGIQARENLGLADGFFENNKENQLKIIEIIRKYQPNLVLANAVTDRHIDHGRAAELVHNACFLSGLSKIITGDLKAWRPKRVLHYIQDYNMKPDIVIDITPWMDRKKECIMAFSSQFYNPESTEPETPISNQLFFKFLEARAREMGRLIGVEFGEGFVTKTPLNLKDLTLI